MQVHSFVGNHNENMLYKLQMSIQIEAHFCNRLGIYFCRVDSWEHVHGTTTQMTIYRKQNLTCCPCNTLKQGNAL